MLEAVKDFLAGVASIFDFTDSANCDLDVVRSERGDYALMEKDWALVGSDLWQGVDTHADKAYTVGGSQKWQ